MSSDKSGVVHHVSAMGVIFVKEVRGGGGGFGGGVVVVFGVVNGNGGSRNLPTHPPPLSSCIYA